MRQISLFIAAVLTLCVPSYSYSIDRKLLNAAGFQELKQDAPALSLVSSEGQTISLKDYKGRVVILHFWDTWCKPCKEEFPLFEKMYQRVKDKDVAFLPIAIDARATQGDIDTFAKGLGATFPVYLANLGNVTDRYWTWGVPVTYFIDKQGLIIARAIGPRNWASPAVTNLIDSILNQN